MSFNKVILLGRLTRDPELRVTANGSNICKFGLAVSRTYAAADGERKEETTFVDVDCFGRQAETIAKYCAKGRQLMVEGRLRLDQWESQTGEKRSKLTVVLEGFQFVGGRDDADASSGSADYAQSSPAPRQAAPAAAPASNDIDEDVPF